MKNLFNIKFDTHTKHFIITLFGIKIKIKNTISNFYSQFDTAKYILNCFVDITTLKKSKGRLREAQLQLSSLMKLIDKICRDNNLQYWLDSGTLLGAFRHKGFIPWDDDVDLCMLREDYIKMSNILKVQLQNDENWTFRERADVCNNFQIRIISKNFDENIGLDIFPVDSYFKENLSTNEKVEITREIKIATKFLNKKYPPKRYLPKDVEQIKNDILKIQNKMILKNQKVSLNKPALFYGIDFPCDAKILIIDYDTVFPLNKIEFEGEQYLCPNDLDSYLKNFYDDYMSFPKEITNDSGLRGALGK